MSHLQEDVDSLINAAGYLDGFADGMDDPGIHQHRIVANQLRGCAERIRARQQKQETVMGRVADRIHELKKQRDAAVADAAKAQADVAAAQAAGAAAEKELADLEAAGKVMDDADVAALDESDAAATADGGTAGTAAGAVATGATDGDTTTQSDSISGPGAVPPNDVTAAPADVGTQADTGATPEKPAAPTA